MKKEERVVNYYLLCNKLKDIVRTGWLNWKVKRERVESVAEHIYGVQMLAIAMKSEYQYDIDIMKVICMLAIHELGETIIGDLTQFEISREEKEKIEHEAVHNILKSLIDGEKIEELFLEFDAHETKEAKFAYYCDKLECDIQCKLYDQENCVDLNQQKENETVSDELIKKMLDTNISWSDMWLENNQKNYFDDKNFVDVSNYVKNKKIQY